MKRLTIIIGMLFTGFVLVNLNSQTKLDDVDIADAIENEYIFDHAINVNNIDIEVIDGIVELEGEVSNLKAKERATKIAKLVKGVRTVSNRIEIDPPEYLSDQVIENLVEKRLLNDPATDLYEIEVDVSDQVVNLSGSVESYQEKRLAEDVSKSVKGVVGLTNNILVNYTTDRSDYEIKNEIEEALKWNALVDDGLIDVRVKNGEVELEGAVASAAEKSDAAYASWVAGVKSVDNSDLRIEWWLDDKDLRKNKQGIVSDDNIEAAIRDASIYDPRVSLFDINVDSKLGWVTLRGEVDNLSAKSAAERLADNTYGVKGVTNRIKVKTDKLTDADIKADIENALSENSITEAWEISVLVDDGIATLTGNVDSYLEKTEAEWVASTIDGVNEINNILDVNYPYGYYWYGHYPYYDLIMNPQPEYVIVPDDAIIKHDVIEELKWSPYVDRDQVNIDVNNGTVTLTGEVDSYREYTEAAKNAIEAGALSVENELVIK